MRIRNIVPVVAALVAVGAIAAGPASAKTFQINVTANNAGCKLALVAVNRPNTAILFHIINKGTVAHGIKFGSVQSTMVPPKSAGDLLINFHRTGTFHFTCTAGKYLHPDITGGGTLKIRA